jgi:hypothetical protein
VDLIGPTELAGLRTLANSSMPDTCVITRGTGRGVYDPETNTHGPAGSEPVWSGRCRVATGVSTEGHEVTVGSLREVLGRYTVHIPHDASPVDVDDVVTVTASADPQLVGQRLSVTSVSLSTVHTHRRLVVEDPQIRER